MVRIILVFVITSLYNFQFGIAQQLEDSDLRNLHIKFCDKYLEGDHLSALTSFEYLVSTENIISNEFVTATGIRLYDSLKKEYKSNEEFDRIIEELRTEANPMGKYNFKDCPPFLIGGIRAEYEDGMSGLIKLVGENLSTSNEDSSAVTFGKIHVRFIVEADGTITEVKIIRGDNHFETQLAEIIGSTSSRWSPGRCNCRPTRSEVIIPLNIHMN